MRPNDAGDQKPDIFPPATPISTLSTTFNPNSTILELVLKLRSCFQLKDSEDVAAILQCREDKLKQTISDLKNREDKLNMNNIELKNQLQALAKKRTSFEANGEKFGLENQLIEIETELKKCRAECEEYRDKLLSAKYELEKVRLDLEMLREKEEMSVERYEKRIGELHKERKEESERLRVEIVKVREELEKERVKGKEEVDKFKGQFAGLIDGKKKAEESAKYWEMNYKQCGPRVMKLEKDLLMMFGNDPVLGKIVKKALSPAAISPKSVINENPELLQRQKQSNLSENAHASPCAGSTVESPMVDTNGPSETAGPNSSVMACTNRMPVENQVVIEIDDSDDEQPIIGTASASKTDKDYGRSCEKRRRIDTDNGQTGYEEYINYTFPEETQVPNTKILEAAYKWKKQNTTSNHN